MMLLLCSVAFVIIARDVAAKLLWHTDFQKYHRFRIFWKKRKKKKILFSNKRQAGGRKEAFIVVVRGSWRGRCFSDAYFSNADYGFVSRWHLEDVKLNERELNCRESSRPPARQPHDYACCCRYCREGDFAHAPLSFFVSKVLHCAHVHVGQQPTHPLLLFIYFFFN